MKFDPDTGLIPAIIQDASTGVVLMMAHMNEEAFNQTIEKGLVTFWSRSRSELWTKGESSGNFLKLVSWSLDCDEDALLIKALPDGPVCHKGSDTCWNELNNKNALAFLSDLEEIIDQRFKSRTEESYTSQLFNKGVNKIAQKVGEEATELIIESKDEDDTLFVAEAADLMFHYLVLLRNRGMSLQDVVNELQKRHI